MVCSQLKVKKYLVCGAILFTWTVPPAVQIILASLSTAVVKGRCLLWLAHSYSMERATGSIVFVIAYLLPLLCTVVCYSRIVYALRNKVTSSASTSLLILTAQASYMVKGDDSSCYLNKI